MAEIVISCILFAVIFGTIIFVIFDMGRQAKRDQDLQKLVARSRDPFVGPTFPLPAPLTPTDCEPADPREFLAVLNSLRNHTNIP